MRTYSSADPASGADWRGSSPRRRATAIGLTLVAELFFLLLLLGLNPSILPKIQAPRDPSLIDLLPDAPKPTPPVRPPAGAAKPKLTHAAPANATPKPTRPQPAPPKPPSFVSLSKSDMAAADISNLGTHSAAGKEASGDGPGGAAGPGEGPGGAHLYNAKWYVEPSDAQLAAYLPKGGVDRGSWAEIACKTIEHYHVENCQPLGESPLGSGLARGIRLAAWQFLVRPPAIDGKPLIGSWVRIRIDFSQDGEK